MRFARRIAVCTSVLCVCVVGLPAVAAEAVVRNAAVLAITAEGVQKHVDALADDTFEGREAGTRGSRAAAGYIVDRIQKLGISGGGAKGSYFQPFDNYRNILAVVTGSDPQLRHQVIVVGGHYDHVGYGTRRNSFGPIGSIHNGADDNASGVSAILETMSAVAQLPEPPKRTILFAFWDGEEKGLLGSRHWVEHPTFPLHDVALMINVDMVGRLRDQRLEVHGSRTSAGLRRLVSELNDSDAMLLDFSWDIRPDSDHYSFFSRNVPFLMFHTGKHPDYHRPSDDPHTINHQGLLDISRLMFHVVVELADAPDIDPFRSAAHGESNGLRHLRSRPLPAPPGRLGVHWDSQKEAQSGEIVIDGITPGSAADRAGLRVGDRMVALAGHPIRGADAFRLRVLAAESPAAAIIERGGQEIEVVLPLVGDAVRIGISWHTDDAEPGVLLVNRITPGSAAHLAGVRTGDRIYRANGQKFADAEVFRRIVTSDDGPLSLELEHNGRLRTVELPTPEALDKQAVEQNDMASRDQPG